MNRILRFAILAVMLMSLLGMFALPASAKVQTTYSYDFATYMPPYTCANGQHLVEYFSIHVDGKNLYDKNGVLFMNEEVVTQTGKEYLVEEPSKVIYYENEHWKNFIKPTGKIESAGIVMKITIPGYGMVFKDIGHYVFEFDPSVGHLVPVTLNGTHQFFDKAGYPDLWDYSVPCAYLTSLP